MNIVIILSEAKNEIEEAATFYESRDEGLGLDFLTEMELAISSSLGHSIITRGPEG